MTASSLADLLKDIAEKYKTAHPTNTTAITEWPRTPETELCVALVDAWPQIAAALADYVVSGPAPTALQREAEELKTILRLLLLDCRLVGNGEPLERRIPVQHRVADIRQGIEALASFPVAEPGGTEESGYSQGCNWFGRGHSRVGVSE